MRWTIRLRARADDLVRYGRPRQDSNLRSRLRRAVLYPLSYGGPVPGPKETVPVLAGPHRTVDTVQVVAFPAAAEPALTQ